MLVVACVLMVTFIVLEAFDTLRSSQLLDEFFFTAVGLYFGRRIPTFQRSDKK